MRRWIRALCAVAICGPLCTPAFARPADEASVERLLVVTRAESLLLGTVAQAEDGIRRGIAQGLGGRPPTPAEQRSIDTAVARVTVLIREQLNWADLEPQFVRIYTETFKQEEVDALLAFYSTPAGQAVIAKMPIVLQKSNAVTQAQMQALLPRMMDILRDTGIERRPD